MAKVPLRVYNHDIEKLIESRHTQEAVAHCKQILKFYPKHIDTYRLLGKAFLESQRYGEASDILQRVLSVVPDDFISQLGMSIIREDEGDLDGAIYHMERAFEVQPANSAIQEELRRLYGRRDGIQPPKIRLTRGALVRMYARGELFTQAIAEASAALEQDPQRLDMQVLLGRLYYQFGQKVKATEVCTQLVDQLPYCYEANRILADVLPSTSRPEDAQVYLERLRALDPYLAFVSEAQPTSTDVPDNAVMVDQLEYDPEQDEAVQPGWTQQVGLAWDENSAAEEKPAWMTGELPDSESPTASVTQQPAENSAQPAEIPDWMVAAGWQPSSGEEVETHLAADDSSSEEIVAPAELPAWLQDLAPEQTAESAEPTEEVEEDTQWLDQILTPGAAPSPKEIPVDEVPQEQPTAEAGDMPEWLKDLEKPVSDTTLSAQPDNAGFDWISDGAQDVSEPAGNQDTSAALTEWFEQQTETQAVDAATAAEGEDVPEWLRPQPGAEVTEEPHTVEADLLPDWLQEIAQEPSAELQTTNAEEQSSAAVAPEAAKAEMLDTSVVNDENQIPVAEDAQSLVPPDDMDAALAWLESLAARQGADEATLTSQPDQRGAEMPEWLRKESESAEEVPGESASKDEFTAEIIEDTPSSEAVVEWQQEASAVEGTVASEEAVETTVPKWLQEQSTVEETDIQEGSPQPEIPEWLQEQSHVEQNIDTEAAIETEVPEWLQEQPAAQPAEETDVPAWLQEQTIPEEISPSADAPIPEWLKELSTEDAPASAVSEEQQEELPDWLDIPASEAAGTAESALEGVDLPEWLKENDEEAAAMAASNQQSDEPFAGEATAKTDDIPLVEEVPQAVPLPGDDIDAALAWMESLAAKQGADEETLTTRPEDRTETAPEWVQQAEADAVDTVQELPSVAESAEIPEPGIEVQETAVESTLEAVAWEAEKTVELPVAEINETIEQPVAEIQADISEPETALSEEPPSTQQPENTGWMMEEELPAEKTQPVKSVGTEDTASEPSPQITAEDEEQDETLPEWLRDLGSYSTDQEAGETSHQETMTEWLPAVDDEPLQPAEVPVVDETETLIEVEQQPSIEAETTVQREAVLEEEILQPAAVEISEPTASVEVTDTKQYEDTPLVTASEAQPERLQNAQNALNRGDIETALSDYDRFIQNGELLEETIHDLRDALYRYPMDTNIWQTLGDAYMHSNRIQEALDAYTKAEELLR